MAKKKETVVKEVLPVEENIVENEKISESVEEETTIETDKEVLEEEATLSDVQCDVQEKLEPEKIIEEFTEAGKKIDEFVRETTTQEELKDKLETELEHAETVESQLEKQIADMEKEITPETKAAFTRFWMGTSESWFN